MFFLFQWLIGLYVLHAYQQVKGVNKLLQML